MKLKKQERDMCKTKLQQYFITNKKIKWQENIPKIGVE
jgi:hypothetical protein